MHTSSAMARDEGVNTGGDYFGEMAKSWDDNDEVHKAAGAIADHLRDVVAPSLSRPWSECTALDFGCGTGVTAFKVAQFAKRVVALDVSEAMVERVRRKVAEAPSSGVEPLQMDLKEPWQMDGRQFDVIYVSMVLHHMPDPVAWVKMAAALLAPGGVLCVYDMAYSADGAKAHREHAPEDAGVHHHGGFSADQLSSLFAAAGFAPPQVVCPLVHIRHVRGGHGHGHSHGHGHGHGHGEGGSTSPSTMDVDVIAAFAALKAGAQGE